MSLSTELIVPAALWTLVAFSVTTWTIILIKAVQHVRLGRHNRQFTQSFWHAPNLQAACRSGTAATRPCRALERRRAASAAR